MAAEAKTGKKKWLKWVAIVVVIVVVALVLWYMWKGNASANQYGSAEAVKAGSTGQYGAWSDSGNDAGFSALFGIGIEGVFWQNIYNADAYGQAWFKGMNIKLNAENVNRFKADVVKFASNASLRKPHWEVTTGSFLKATAA